MAEHVTALRLFDPPAAVPVNRLAGILSARALRRAIQGIDESLIAEELLHLAGGDQHTVAAALERIRYAA